MRKKNKIFTYASKTTDVDLDMGKVARVRYRISLKEVHEWQYVRDNDNDKKGMRGKIGLS